jgi:hypothetical protein
VNINDLAAALRACAAGLYPLEAGTELLIGNETFLHRDDFTTRFISHGTSGGTPMAAIDWDAAITALGGLPCSGGERRILQLSASLAAGIPVSLRETVTGLDDANVSRLLTAIRHATGRRADANLQSYRSRDCCCRGRLGPTSNGHAQLGWCRRQRSQNNWLAVVWMTVVWAPTCTFMSYRSVAP